MIKIKHRKFWKSLTGTGFIFGFGGWFYIAENAVFHPITLGWQLTHFYKYPHEDTFGVFCFAISLICCFAYQMLRE